eukprot:SAG22_NODE_7192_length_764_cov_1.553383_2_plen_99_part_00
MLEQALDALRAAGAVAVVCVNFSDRPLQSPASPLFHLGPDAVSPKVRSLQAKAMGLPVLGVSETRRARAVPPARFLCFVPSTAAADVPLPLCLLARKH